MGPPNLSNKLPQANTEATTQGGPPTTKGADVVCFHIWLMGSMLYNLHVFFRRETKGSLCQGMSPWATNISEKLVQVSPKSQNHTNSHPRRFPLSSIPKNLTLEIPRTLCTSSSARCLSALRGWAAEGWGVGEGGGIEWKDTNLGNKHFFGKPPDCLRISGTHEPATIGSLSCGC